MKIHIKDAQSSLIIQKKQVRTLVRAILTSFDSSHNEVGLYFVSEEEICDMHDRFFQDPSPTDCISFPIDNEYLGDVFVCPQTALAYAMKTKKDPYQELALYIIHGLLHCLGYDDIASSDRKTMRKMEKRCIALLKEQHILLGP